MKLTAKNVDEIVFDCLARDGEFSQEQEDQIRKSETLPAGWKLVAGIMRTFVFNEARVKIHENDIRDMLFDLPDNFMKSKGGGWTFLNACETKDGTLWGEHVNMESLFCLGIASGLARWLLPKDMWPSLPGGMPYVVVNDEQAPQLEAAK